MNELLRCECGFEVRAGDVEGLVAQVRSHAWHNHHMALTRTEALELIRSTVGLVADKDSHLPEELP